MLFFVWFFFNSSIESIRMKVLVCSYRCKHEARAAVPELLRGIPACWQLLLLVPLVLCGLGTAVPGSDYFDLITEFSVWRGGVQLHSSSGGFKSLW